jgi:hypothetical protein
MALQFGGSNQNGGIAPNAYINDVVVKGIKNLSGEDTPWGKPRDLALEFEFGIPGKDFTIRQTIGGDFKRVDGAVSDWGAAFSIDYLVRDSNYLETLSTGEAAEFAAQLEDGVIPERFIDFLMGKALHRITYVKGIKADGKLHWTPFNIVGFNKDGLVKTFLSGLKKGFPKNYQPTAQTLTQTEVDDQMGSGDAPADEDMI